MQIVLFLLFIFIALPVAFKFPNLIKSILSGVFNSAICFIKHLPEMLNNNNKRK